MIKILSTILGEVFSPETFFTTKDGKQISQLTIKTRVPSYSTNFKEKDIFLTAFKKNESLDLSTFKAGDKIIALGDISLKKKDNKIFFNLSIKEIHLSELNANYSIKGEMDFLGVVGKNIVTKTIEEKKEYTHFPAYSLSFLDNERQYIWIHFIKKDFLLEEEKALLKPRAKIHVKGDVEIKFYKDHLDFNCRIKSLDKWKNKFSSLKEEKKSNLLF